eukprot:1478762-Rhodomonas_salina.5
MMRVPYHMIRLQGFSSHGPAVVHRSLHRVEMLPSHLDLWPGLAHSSMAITVSPATTPTYCVLVRTKKLTESWQDRSRLVVRDVEPLPCARARRDPLSDLRLGTNRLAPQSRMIA